MSDKALTAYGVLAGWSTCYICHQPVEPWAGKRPSIHPTCYLVRGFLHDDWRNFVDRALEAILNE